VAKGEWLAVMGPSGSGKSTLLNILSCLDSLPEDRVAIDGEDLARLGAAELARFRAEKVGFIFRQFHLVPYLTVLANVMLAQYSHGLAEEQEAAEALRRRGWAVLESRETAFAAARAGRGGRRGIGVGRRREVSLQFAEALGFELEGCVALVADMAEAALGLAGIDDVARTAPGTGDGERHERHGPQLVSGCQASAGPARSESL
jgi:ABC-type Fe3+/spermidine/putrescine transport system ATPase subunit